MRRPLTHSFSSASHLLFPLQREVVVVMMVVVQGFDGAASPPFSLSASLMIPAFGAHFRDIKGSSSLSAGATAPRGRIEGCVWKLSSLSYSRLRLWFFRAWKKLNQKSRSACEATATPCGQLGWRENVLRLMRRRCRWLKAPLSEEIDFFQIQSRG